MSKYRKKPVVIEAVERDDMLSANRAQLLPDWFNNAYDDDVVTTEEDGDTIIGVFIETREGTMEAMPGDFIIRGIKGEIYPCKPDIFEATYDPVDESAPSTKEHHPAVAHLLGFFNFQHLPEHLQAVSKPFHDLAVKVAALPEGPEQTVALRKLLEAKDCAVRTMVK